MGLGGCRVDSVAAGAYVVGATAVQLKVAAGESRQEVTPLSLVATALVQKDLSFAVLARGQGLLCADPRCALVHPGPLVGALDHLGLPGYRQWLLSLSPWQRWFVRHMASPSSLESPQSTGILCSRGDGGSSKATGSWLCPSQALEGPDRPPLARPLLILAPKFGHGHEQMAVLSAQVHPQASLPVCFNLCSQSCFAAQ